jgi:hypothetical protein
MAGKTDQYRGPAERKAGHIFWMPAGATWLNRDKPRPFALVTRSAPGALATLVYGSTRDTERRAGAACIEVAPIREGLNRNRLRARTWFYPGTLLPLDHEDLPQHAGFLGNLLAELRSALRTALGIGQGSCLGAGSPAGSLRGRIVVLSTALSHDIRTAFAVVLTEPRYSAQRSYQIILPIYSLSVEKTGEHHVVVSSAEWLRDVPAWKEGIVLPIPTTNSVWHAYDIKGETEHVVDDGTLDQIDRALCGFFSLPEPGAR